MRRAKDQEPEADDEFAGKSQQDLSRRLSRITQELERVAAEKGEHEGQRKQAREVAREHANDLATARYKGVEERHRRAMIDKETTEMARPRRPVTPSTRVVSRRGCVRTGL